MGGDERFFAWLDGELTGAEAAEMERRVAADSELQRLAERHRALRERLQTTFAAVAEAEVPDQLLAPLRPGESQVIEFRQTKPPWWSRLIPQAAALAASLALGVFIGTTALQREALVEASGGRLYAAGGLDDALDAQLASAPSNSAVRLGITFRDAAGAICRSFTEAQSSGLACRSADRWEVRGLFAAPPGQTGEYRMAAGTDPNLAALIEQTMSGAPLDAAQEQAARDRGWR